MALTSTVYKATLHVADLNRQYYNDHAVTVARHPSETDERLMIRLLAFALHADPELAFGRGIGVDDEPALWKKDLTGAVTLWIEIGQPDEKRLRQACGRAGQVFVYAYGGRSVDLWWDKVGPALARFENLSVVSVPSDATRALASLSQRSLDLHCTIQDGHALLGDGTNAVQVELSRLRSSAV